MLDRIFVNKGYCVQFRLEWMEELSGIGRQGQDRLNNSPDSQAYTAQRMRYFAYGSNMLTHWLRCRVPSARPLGMATLQRHTLRWHKRSVDGSGKCNAVATGNEADAVLGVLFDISTDEKPALDLAEGAGKGYVQSDVCAETQSGRVAAFTYLAQPTAIDEALKPYDWYKALVVTGARKHGLPQDYVKELDAQETTSDSKSPNAQKARRILEVVGGA